MAGVLGVGGDLTKWTEEELAESRDWVGLYKEIRPVVQRGDLHRLRPPAGGLSAVQYVLRDETVVLAWLQAQHYGEPVAPLRLRGLDPSATYECCETGEVHRGAVLLHHGLPTGLHGDFDATVVRLRRI
jgi:alpha-galactosidase